MRSIFALILLLLIAAQSSAAEAAPSDSSGVESLGNELLENLAPNTFDLEKPAQTGPRAPTDRTPRFDDLGEDIGQPSGSLSLSRVRLGMQHAQSLLAAKHAENDMPALTQAGDVQREVVAQLDKLIAELSKQCKNCNGQSGAAPPKPSQRRQSKTGKSGAAAAKSQTAARDSTDRLNNAAAKPADKGDIEAITKDLWGHLPERSREQMMQSFSAEFLPKYELEIEQYYRRLSEENDTTSSPK